MKIPRLSQNHRMQAVDMVEGRLRPVEVARCLGWELRSYTDFWIGRESLGRLQTGCAPADQELPPLRKIVTFGRHIYVTGFYRLLEQQQLLLDERTNNWISTQTVRNRLSEFGLWCRLPYHGPMLRRRHRNLWIQWEQCHVRRTQIQWNTVVFSDESGFCLRCRDGRARVYRRSGEHYVDACVQELDRFGGGSIMILGGISFHHPSPLVIEDQRYRDGILQRVVLPLFTTNSRLTFFQQDNVRCHIAHICINFLQQQNLALLPWPAVSPDQSPIEYLWDN
jgi:hypothetical protein